MDKVCTICAADVTHAHRVRDPLGRYFCKACYEAARKVPPGEHAATPPAPKHSPTPQRAATPQVAAPAEYPPPAVPSPAAGSSADNEYDLAPTPQPKEVAKAACGRCKRVLPEHVVSFHDGEFVCRECLASAASPARPVPPKRLAAKVTEPDDDGHPSALATFLASGPGIAVTIGGTVLATFAVMAGVLIQSRFLGLLSPGLVALIAGTLVVYCVVLAGLLILSMYFVDQIFGGVGFGTVSDVIWKSMLIVVLDTVIQMYAERNETLQMLSLALRPGAILVGFVLIFHIDFFEAMVLAVTNWLLGWMAKIALMSTFFWLVSGDSAPIPALEGEGPQHAPPQQEGNPPARDGDEGGAPDMDGRGPIPLRPGMPLLARS